MKKFIGILSAIGTWMKEHKKSSIGIIVGVLFIALMVTANVYDKNKKAEAEALEKESKTEETQPMTQFDKDQEKYVERWGEPNEGFVWNDNGELQAIGEADKSPEDVAYIYIRSLSTLDFANAQRYSYKTQSIKQYSSYFDTETEFNYNIDFKRNMYKEVLLSMEPLEVTNTASFSDFREVITMQIELLDLSNKDFWKEDKESLFTELEKYRITEKDTTKMKDFIYNYVMGYYTSSKPKTELRDVNLVVEQTMEGSWLVTNDSDLDAIAQYMDGETVVSDIMNNFEDWLSDKSGRSDEEESEESSSSSSQDLYDGQSADDLTDHDEGLYDNSDAVDFSKDYSNADTGAFDDTTESYEADDGSFDE